MVNCKTTEFERSGVYKRQVYTFKGGERANSGRKKGLKAVDTTEKNRALNARRAYERCFEYGLSLNCKSFITLTYQANEQNMDKALEDLKGFIRNMRDIYPNDSLKYIATIEFQDGDKNKLSTKRGAIHFHLLFNHKVGKQKTQAAWLEYGQANNSADIKYIPAGLQQIKSIKYICKYIIKNFNDDRLINENTKNRRKAYLVSKGVKNMLKTNKIIEKQYENFEDIKPLSKEHFDIISSSSGIVIIPEYQGHGMFLNVEYPYSKGYYKLKKF